MGGAETRRSRRIYWLYRLQVRLVPVMARVITRTGLRRLRELPAPPAWVLHSVDPPLGPWPDWERPIPESLRSVAGIRRDREAEAQAFAAEPLNDYAVIYSKAVRFILLHAWMSFLPVASALLRVERALHRNRRTNAQGRNGRRGEDELKPSSPGLALAADTVAPQPPVSAVISDLTHSLKKYAAELGLSKIGIAVYDEKYTFTQYHGRHSVGSVIVCLLEQNWEATQTAPSSRAERAALHTYVGLEEMGLKLAEWLQERGYGAEAHNESGEAVVIHYGVESGLGQLGLNGQLLTPQAGSRCRIVLVTTDAPLAADVPVDYGMSKICDSCKACVRRCPVGAIPNRRRLYRGVEKAKINTKRCYPIVATASGCAVCMKVCPIQRYGLAAVLDEYEVNGRVLGAGSDELEGYFWPPDGRFYGAKTKPRVGRDMTAPAGFALEPIAPEPKR